MVQNKVTSGTGVVAILTSHCRFILERFGLVEKVSGGTYTVSCFMNPWFQKYKLKFGASIFIYSVSQKLSFLGRTIEGLKKCAICTENSILRLKFGGKHHFGEKC